MADNQIGQYYWVKGKDGTWEERVITPDGQDLLSVTVTEGMNSPPPPPMPEGNNTPDINTQHPIDKSWDEVLPGTRIYVRDSNVSTLPVTIGDRRIMAHITESSDISDAQQLAIQAANSDEAHSSNPQSNMWMVYDGEGHYINIYDATDINDAKNRAAEIVRQRREITEHNQSEAQLENNITNSYNARDMRLLEQQLSQETARLAQAEGIEFGEMFKGLANDLAGGFTEMPTQVVSGAISGINEMMDSAQELAQLGVQRLPQGVQDFLNKPIGMSDEEFQRLKSSGQYDANDFPDIPNLTDNANTTTGGVVRAISQFGVGLLGAGKALEGWNAASKAGIVSKSIAEQAIAGMTAFDQADERVSDVMQAVPALRNPITEYLAGDMNDSALEGRIKMALEGIALGAGGEAMGVALGRGIRALRQARVARREVEAEAQNVVQQSIKKEARVAAELKDARSILGDEQSPLFSLSVERNNPSSQIEVDALNRAARANTNNPIRQSDPSFARLSGQTSPNYGNNPFSINFSKFKTEEDVQSVAAQMVEAFADEVNISRRGVRNSKATNMAATNILQDDEKFQALLSRRQGQALNAEEIKAYQRIWQASAQRLTQVANIVSSHPSDANLAVYEEMKSVHRLIQNQILGARAESGRSMQAWKNYSGSSSSTAQRLNDILENNRMTIIDEARAVAALGDVDTIVEQSSKAYRMTNAIRSRTIIQSAMLYSLSVTNANIAGNMLGFLSEVGARAGAEFIGKVWHGGSSEIKSGESIQLFAGGIKAFQDTFKNPEKVRAFLHSMEDMPHHIDYGGNHLFPEHAASQNPRVSATYNFLNDGITLPNEINAAGDRLQRYIAYNASMNASAYRAAVAEAEQGIIPYSNVAKRQSELFLNPTDEMVDEAFSMAEETTWSRSQEKWPDANGKLTINGTGRSFLELRRTIEGDGKSYWRGIVSGLVAPFINASANLWSYAMRSTPIAPIFSGTFKRYAQDIAAGGARAELARGRVAFGSTVIWSAFSFAMSGFLTGAGPANIQQRQALLRTGWQPNSIKISDEKGNSTYYAYDRLDPMGSLLGIGATLADIALNIDSNDQNQVDIFGEAVLDISAAIGVIGTNKRMIGGITDLVNLIAEPQMNIRKFYDRKIGALVPSWVRSAERAKDPYYRDGMIHIWPGTIPEPMRNILEGIDNFILKPIKTQLPFLSETQPIRRDMWGQPTINASGLGSAWEMLSPVKVSKERGQPIDLELIRLQYYPSMPDRILTLPDELRFGEGDTGKLELRDRPDLYNRFLMVRGETMLPRLNDLVQSNGYQNLSEEDKKDEIQSVMFEETSDAWEKVIQENYEDIADWASRRKSARRALQENQ